MKKKILYLMEYPIDLPGGAQMSTRTLCEGLDHEQYEIVVACPMLLHPDIEETLFRIVPYQSNENREKNKVKRIYNFLSRIGSFRRIIKEEKPDLIHIQMSESLITYGMMRIFGEFSEIPFVYTDRSLYFGYRIHSMTCIKATLKHAAGMICTTQTNKDLWVKNSNISNIKVIPNTISNAFDDYDHDKRCELRKKAGLKEDDFVIGFAGRISEEKDWPFVKELVPLLKASGISMKIALVLSVYEAQDEAIANDLKTAIIQSVGEENFLYMQDLSQAEIADYYYLVDVFMMTSMFESFGKAAIEAMSRKCAVISTRVGGLPEVIGKEEDLYTKETVETCIARVQQLCNDRKLLQEEKEFFYQRFHENYTQTSCIKNHEVLYQKILKGETIL